MRRTVKYIFRFLAVVYTAGIAMLMIPAVLGIHVLAVTSGSMEPTIPVGSVVYVQPVDFEDIQKGDIITFCLDKPGIKVTHRVVKKDEELKCLSTKGDANEEPDSHPVSCENVEGIVRCAIPHMGRIAVLLNETSGKVVLVSIFLLLAALDDSLNKSRKVI